MSGAPVPSVAIVGLGFGRAHVPAFQAAGARVVAVCQRDEAAARKVAAAYGVPHSYGRWEAMLGAQHPDVVVIATPPHLHRAIARAASATGAHVLCEKPLATTREDAEAIVADVTGAGRVGMTGFNWRFTAAMRRLRALMADGAVGRVLHVRGHWLGARWADEASATTWRMDRAQAGHGAMGDMGVHLVDLVRWTCGDFARVTAHAGIAYPDKPVAGTGRATDAEDYVSLVGELVSGAQVTFLAQRLIDHGDHPFHFLVRRVEMRRDPDSRARAEVDQDVVCEQILRHAIAVRHVDRDRTAADGGVARRVHAIAF